MADEIRRETRTGKDVVVREGKAFLKDASGNIFRANVDAAGEQILSGQYEPATAEDVKRRELQKRAGDTPGVALVESAAAGAFDAVTALPRAATGAYAAATGEQDPLGDVSGRKLIESVVAVGAGERAADAYAEESRFRAEESPIESGAGRVAGEIVGGGLLSRGSGLVGQAAQGLTGSRVAGRLTAGVTEGASLGYVQAGEDAYIADVPLTAEQALAGMGWGALLGGGFSGGAELVGRAGGRLGRKFAPGTAPGAGTGGPYRTRGQLAAAASPGPKAGTLEGSLSDFAEERVLKTLGARGSDIRRLGRTGETAEKNMRQLAREVLEHKLDNGEKVFPEGVVDAARMGHDDLLERVRTARDESGARLGTLRRKVDDYLETSAPQLKPDTAALVRQIEKEIIDPLRKSAVPQVVAKADNVTDTVGRMAARLGPSPKLSELTQARIDLDSIVYPKATAPGLAPLPPAARDELIHARNIIEQHIEAATDRGVAAMDPRFAGSYAKLKGKYKSFLQATQIAEKAGLQDLGNRVVSPTDYLVGAAAAAGDIAGGGGALSILKGAAVSGAHKAVREHGSAVMAVLADKLSKQVAGKTQAGVSGFFTRWTTPKAARPATKAPSSGKARDAARRAALPASITLFASDGESRRAAYRRRVAELNEALSSNGAPLRARVVEALGGLENSARRTAGEVANTAARGAAFLASKVPAGTSSKRLLPHTSEPIVSDSEIAKFARYWSAVVQPLSVLDDFRRGLVTKEQIEALEVVYPRMYANLKTTVQARLVDLDMKGQSLPYQAVIQLDMLLGLNGAGEPTATPGFMIRYAGYLEQAAALEMAAQPPPEPVTGLADKAMGATEEIEERDV